MPDCIPPLRVLKAQTPLFSSQQRDDNDDNDNDDEIGNLDSHT